MRLRAIWLVALLVLLPGLAVGQEFIRYFPPAGVSTSTSTPGFSYASNVGSLVNGGTTGTPVPQTFNVYNFCDGAACATGYERVGLGFAANVAVLGVTVAGTGTARPLTLSAGVATYLALNVSGDRWYVGSAGDFYGAATDTYNLGLAANLTKSLYLSRSIQGSKSKTLTDAAAAASVVRIAVATNGYIGGKIIWTATSTDATDQLVTSGEQFFSGADKAGTVTCGTGAAVGTATAYTTAKTLVCTVTVATSTTNCDIQASCTNDTAGSQNVIFNYRLDMPLTATVTPQ